MKILAKKKEVSEALWWVGEILECYSCECRFELEKEDEPQKEKYEFNNRDLIDFTTYKIECPNCKETTDVRGVEH